ncbi:MAG: Mth family G-protein coupled receptor, partial [bacterium]|nr:Mth family G-protein coupled receptor [bacterium]
MSYDFFITFAKIRPADVHGNNKRFKKYVAVTTSSASIVVLVCVFTGISGTDLYGDNGRCFLSNIWANLFAFAVPVGMILVTNVILMFITIIRLRSMREANRRALSSANSNSSRKNIMLSVMTLKLSILFGLGWLFGYLDGLVSNQALAYCYNVIVSCQGVLVFLAFGCH